MKLDPKYLIERACSTEIDDLAHPYLDAERGVMEASDSYLAVRVPVQVTRRDRSGYVPVQAILFARAHDARIECLASVCRVRVGGRVREFARPTYGRHQVVADAIRSTVSLPTPNLPTPRFAVDVSLVERSAQAMGATRLLWVVRDAHAAIELRRHGEPELVGVSPVAVLMGLKVL